MGVDVDLAHDPPVASIPKDKVAKVKRYLREVLDAKVWGQAGSCNSGKSFSAFSTGCQACW
jgi:hypothetical protein